MIKLLFAQVNILFLVSRPWSTLVGPCQLSVLDFGTMSSSLSIRSVAIADSGFSGLQHGKTRTQRVCSGQLNFIQRSVPARVRQTGEQLLGW